MTLHNRVIWQHSITGNYCVSVLLTFRESQGVTEHSTTFPSIFLQLYGKKLLSSGFRTLLVYRREKRDTVHLSPSLRTELNNSFRRQLLFCKVRNIADGGGWGISFYGLHEHKKTSGRTVETKVSNGVTLDPVPFGKRENPFVTPVYNIKYRQKWRPNECSTVKVGEYVVSNIRK